MASARDMFNSEWRPPATAATTALISVGWKSIGTATLTRSNPPGGLRVTSRSARDSRHASVRSPATRVAEDERRSASSAHP